MSFQLTRKNRRLTLLATAALTAALVTALPAPASEQRAADADGWPQPSMPISELEPGQKGYGLSVFAGAEPRRFEVEVLGVLRNTTAELSYVLARLSGQDLERSGVVAGMSGSPVYVDGRLVGAVAFSYLYGLDAIAGITPVTAMRRLLPAPEVGGMETTPASKAPTGLEVTFDDLLRRDFDPDQLSRQLSLLAPPAAADGGARRAVQWTAGGFGAPAAELLGRHLGSLVPAGTFAGASGGGTGTVGEAAPELAPGSAVAAMLVTGDLVLAAHGTVTDRRGDEILAFGHAVFGLGPVTVPMATSDVVTVIANVYNSFKLSNAGALIGAFEEDREAGVRGRVGVEAPTTPVTVRLRGEEEREYRMRVAAMSLRPLLVTVATLGAVTSGSYTAGLQGVDFEARFRLAGHDDLVLRQSFDGDSASTAAVLHLLNFATWLETTPLEAVEIEGVEVEMTQVDRPRTATLVSAYPERTRVAPGETVTVTLELQPFQGERIRRRVEVPVPADAPAGRYSLLVGDGSTLDAVRLALEGRAPQSFEQALGMINSFHSRRQLQVLGVVADSGVAVAGESLPSLPGSVRTLYAASGATAASALSLTILHRQLEELDRPLEGVTRIDLEVREEVD